MPNDLTYHILCIKSSNRIFKFIIEVLSFFVSRVFDQIDSSKELVQPTEHSSGDILVEVEPVRYELDIHDISNDKMFKNRPKETKKHEMLVNGSLFRFDDGRDETARLQKVFSYELKKSEYYGQVFETHDNLLKITL